MSLALQTAAPDQQKLVVVSVSPQSRASLAARFQLSPADAAKKLTAFFKKLGVHYVFDTAFSRNFSLLESQREFVQRFRGQANSTQALPVLTSACPGVSTLLDAGNGNAGEGGSAGFWQDGLLGRRRHPESHLAPQDRDLTDASSTRQWQQGRDVL